ncbi:hypothetical protein [Yaravirus sp. 'brasiliensis']|uniref:Uncharacterized protein n=1 Tax=Yaravirus sp. 'brasiliensis' TaxID=2739681 RepID=A0AAE7B7W1_9VIRU|nr:hypothetical protein QKS73_gp21 [Yaravirus brasiliensis]QKE44394.1 hypothetical protein [Yaravirus brasiliensis]
MFNYNFIAIELLASVIGSYVTMHIFGGSYFTNLAGNLLIMVLGDAMHWYLNQQTLFFGQ